MSDWDGPDLATIAPEVDEAAAQVLFDRRRARYRNRRRARLAVGAVALVTVAGVGIAGLTGDATPDVSVAAGGSNGTRPVAGGDDALVFEVLAVGQSGTFGDLSAATDQAAFDVLWSTVGLDGPTPPVDFGASVVVSITIADDACPPTLVGFDEQEDNALTPIFEEPPGGCELPLISRTFVVTLNRAAVAPAFTLRLAADPFYHDERTLIVDVTMDREGEEAPSRAVDDLGAVLFTYSVPAGHCVGCDYAVAFDANGTATYTEEASSRPRITSMVSYDREELTGLLAVGPPSGSPTDCGRGVDGNAPILRFAEGTTIDLCFVDVGAAHPLVAFAEGVVERALQERIPASTVSNAPVLATIRVGDRLIHLYTDGTATDFDAATGTERVFTFDAAPIAAAARARDVTTVVDGPVQGPCTLAGIAVDTTYIVDHPDTGERVLNLALCSVPVDRTHPLVALIDAIAGVP